MRGLAIPPTELITVSLALSAVLMLLMGIFMLLAEHRLRKGRRPEEQSTNYGLIRVLAVGVIASASFSLGTLSAAAAVAREREEHRRGSGPRTPCSVPPSSS